MPAAVTDDPMVINLVVSPPTGELVPYTPVVCPIEDRIEVLSVRDSVEVIDTGDAVNVVDVADQVVVHEVIGVVEIDTAPDSLTDCVS